MGVLLAFIMLFLLIYIFIFKNFIKKLGSIIFDNVQATYRYVNEPITGFMELKVLDLKSYFLNRMKRASQNEIDSQIKFQTLNILPRYFTELILIFFTLSTILILVYLRYSLEEITIFLGIFAIAGVRLLPIQNSLIQCFNQIRLTLKWVDKLYEHYNLLIIEDNKSISHSSPKNIEKNKTINEVNSLEFKKVFFDIMTKKIIF